VSGGGGGGGGGRSSCLRRCETQTNERFQKNGSEKDSTRLCPPTGQAASRLHCGGQSQRSGGVDQYPETAGGRGPPSVCFGCSQRSSRVQQLYYAELRQKLLLSQSHHEEALFFLLAALALQAEVGDHRETNDEDFHHYFLPEDYFPSWLIKRRGRDYVLQNVGLLHAELRGEASSRAVLRFIREANRLQDAALTLYRMRQEINGIHQILLDFSWNDIDSLTFQGSKFEIVSSASLCIPKLVYHSPSAFHSKHILMHIRDSHRLHFSTREAAIYVQHLEDMEAGCCYRESYICDTTALKQRLQNILSSMSDCSAAEEDEGTPSEAKLWMDEEFVDDPADVPWLAEVLFGVSVDGPLVLTSSCWAAVTAEMKQVLWRRAGEAASVD
uniref:FERM C-terminal PH-like domain-containing protein n=1 Tax=Oryzias latipes TaxID=8090 RepID=A0A3B3I2F9_ORYLA